MKTENIWYAVQESDQDDWSVGSFDKAEAFKMLHRQGHGLIAVIENGICTKEISIDNRNDPETLAELIRNSDEWDFEALADLCRIAGIDDEWNAADDMSFEAVAYKAAEILGVEI